MNVDAIAIAPFLGAVLALLVALLVLGIALLVKSARGLLTRHREAQAWRRRRRDFARAVVARRSR